MRGILGSQLNPIYPECRKPVSSYFKAGVGWQWPNAPFRLRSSLLVFSSTAWSRTGLRPSIVGLSAIVSTVTLHILAHDSMSKSVPHGLELYDEIAQRKDESSEPEF